MREEERAIPRIGLHFERKFHHDIGHFLEKDKMPRSASIWNFNRLLKSRIICSLTDCQYMYLICSKIAHVYMLLVWRRHHLMRV